MLNNVVMRCGLIANICSSKESVILRKFYKFKCVLLGLKRNLPFDDNEGGFNVLKSTYTIFEQSLAY